MYMYSFLYPWLNFKLLSLVDISVEFIVISPPVSYLVVLVPIIKELV